MIPRRRFPRLGRALIALVALGAMVTGCTQITLRGPEGSELVGLSGVITLTNLHPNRYRSRLYSENFQTEALIPLGTAVKIVTLTPRRMTFVVLESGIEYAYLRHRGLAEPFTTNVVRYFGTTPLPLEAKNVADREGIVGGRVSPGMTRDGVILAIGYPPVSTTRDLGLDRWIYRKSRSDQFTVVFGPLGSVDRIEE